MTEMTKEVIKEAANDVKKDVKITSKKETILAKIVIDALVADEMRVAVVEDGEVIEYDSESQDKISTKGNIYQGVIAKVERGLQACFIDYGFYKHGFLSFDELIPEAFLPLQTVDQNYSRKDFFDRLKVGDRLLVQVIKEARGDKGPSMTTKISLPGRFMVLLPFINQIALSRKITEAEERDRIKGLLSSLKIPKNMGLLGRTVALGVTRIEMQRDVNFLLRQWYSILANIDVNSNAKFLHQDNEISLRFIRDYYTPKIQEIWVDSESTYQKVAQYLSIILPRNHGRLKLYTGKVPVFTHFGIETQINALFERKVPLKSGGSIVIDVTEAFISIDVNSGKMLDKRDIEGTSLQTNLEAANEICRQLRLRDLGGIVVIDFIDMKLKRNRIELERFLLKALRKDKARTKVNRFSANGILTLTRQRIKPNLSFASHELCENCNGTGQSRTLEFSARQMIRSIRSKVSIDTDITKVVVTCNPNLAFFMLNTKKAQLLHLENDFAIQVLIDSDENLQKTAFKINCLTDNDYNEMIQQAKAAEIAINPKKRMKIVSTFSKVEQVQANQVPASSVSFEEPEKKVGLLDKIRGLFQNP